MQFCINAVTRHLQQIFGKLKTNAAHRHYAKEEIVGIILHV